MFYSPISYFISTISYLLRPILPFTTFPQTTLSLLRSPTTIYHCLTMAQSEMVHIREPDIDFIRRESDKETHEETEGLFGVWSAGNLDHWVGKDGPMARAAMGEEQGGRVKCLEGVPHAFCLSE
jgi:hypothetical protein